MLRRQLIFSCSLYISFFFLSFFLSFLFVYLLAFARSNVYSRPTSVSARVFVGRTTLQNFIARALLPNAYFFYGRVHARTCLRVLLLVCSPFVFEYAPGRCIDHRVYTGTRRNTRVPACPTLSQASICTCEKNVYICVYGVCVCVCITERTSTSLPACLCGWAYVCISCVQ